MRDEKVKALRSVRRIKPDDVSGCAVRGQYAAGEIAAEAVPGYRGEEGVAKDSAIETYAALTLYVDNWRWAGVPFYLRSGKRLAARSTEVVITFKHAPHTPFARREGGATARPNTLVASISPHEGVVLQVEGKQPGQEMQLRPIDLDFWYTEGKGAVASPSAYEHLLLDALRGDPTFFARADEVEAAWEIVEPVIEKWEAEAPKDFPNYKAGSSGPQGTDATS